MVLLVGHPPANAEDMGVTASLGMSHMLQDNYACTPQLLSLRSRARVLLILKPTHTRAHVLQLLKPADPRVHLVQADSSHLLKLEKAHVQ